MTDLLGALRSFVGGDLIPQHLKRGGVLLTSYRDNEQSRAADPILICRTQATVTQAMRWLYVAVKQLKVFRVRRPSPGCRVTAARRPWLTRTKQVPTQQKDKKMVEIDRQLD